MSTLNEKNEKKIVVNKVKMLILNLSNLYLTFLKHHAFNHGILKNDNAINIQLLLPIYNYISFLIFLV